MPADFEDLFDLENLPDDEIHELIMQEITEFPELDADGLDVLVDEGFVTLSGRVGTEQELQQIQHTVEDTLGIRNYSNDLVVDGLVRLEQPEGADDAIVEETELQTPTRSEASERTDPQADHLMEDLETEQFGTQEMQRSIERGEAYEAPDRPIQEGTWSEENH